MGTPLFTPTTKAEVGHDENMTMEDLEKLLGKAMAEKAKQAALQLFQRGSEVMRKRGLVLLDTKYEFGTDENGVLHVIDEVNTPDSSRLIDISEWEAKYPKVAAEMATGQYKDVSALLTAKPDLKMKEFSKQYVRDALLGMGFNPAKDSSAPKLTEDQVVECSYRYISIYERITGKQFVFPEVGVQPAERILKNLQRARFVTGAYAVVMADSDSNMPHLQALKSELAKFKIPCEIRICSAHKQPARLEGVIQHYNKSIQPLLLIGCAGGTDALSSIASYSSLHPVISCPPDGSNTACLTNPSGSSSGLILEPANVAKFAAQMFSPSCPEVRVALAAQIQENITKLEKADAVLQG